MPESENSSVGNAVKGKMLAFRKDIEKLTDEIDRKQFQLKEEQIKRAEADAELSTMSSRVKQLEDEIQITDKSLQDASYQLEAITKIADESERARKVLTNRQNADDDRIESLENYLKESSDAAAEAERKYEETARKLQVTEAELAKWNQRTATTEKHLIKLESDLRNVGSTLKVKQNYQEQFIDREESYESKIRLLSGQLKEANVRAQQHEYEVQRKKKMLEITEEKLAEIRKKYQSMKKEMEGMYHDIAAI